MTLWKRCYIRFGKRVEPAGRDSGVALATLKRKQADLTFVANRGKVKPDESKAKGPKRVKVVAAVKDCLLPKLALHPAADFHRLVSWCPGLSVPSRAAVKRYFRPDSRMHLGEGIQAEGRLTIASADLFLNRTARKDFVSEYPKYQVFDQFCRLVGFLPLLAGPRFSGCQPPTTGPSAKRRHVSRPSGNLHEFH